MTKECQATTPSIPEVSAAGRPRRTILPAVLRERGFRRIWLAMGVSSLGDWVGILALMALVAGMAGKRGGGTGQAALGVSGVLAIRMVPGVLFGSFAGVIVDRWDRRRTMIACDLARAALMASIPFVQTLPYILTVSFLMEVMSLLWIPAKDSSLPNLVPKGKLLQANQLSITISYGTLPLAGVVFASFALIAAALGHIGALDFFKTSRNQASLAILADAASFLFSAFMVSRLVLPRERARRAKSEGPKAFFAELVEGWRFVAGHELVGPMMLGILGAFLSIGVVLALGSVLAERTLGAGAAGWGLLVTGLGVGMGIGMLGASWVMRFVSKQAAFPAAIILAGFVMTLTANGPSIGYVMLGAGIMGLCAGFAWVTGYTLLHENVSDELRGRTFATLYALVRLCLFLSLVVAPLAVIAVGEHTLEVGGRALDVGGVRLVLMAGGVLAAVSGLVARRRMRERPSQALLRLGLKVAQASGEHRGLLVVFEGVEGSGKSTQLEMLREELTRSGREVVVTREPGGTAIAERIREILLDTAAAEMVAKTEALLYAAARAQHVSEVVAPALERGAIVLSDRYLDSSLAYQGLVRGLGHETILELNRWASGDLLPDVVILLKVDPAVGLARAGTDLDRLESEGLEFHQRVAKAFLTLAREYRDRYVVIDATGSPEEVQAQVRSAVAPRL